MTEEERKEEVKRLQKEFKGNAKDFQNQAKGKIEKGKVSVSFTFSA